MRKVLLAGLALLAVGCSTATPLATSNPTASSSPSPAPTAEPTAAPTPTVAPTPSATATAIAAPSATPAATASPGASDSTAGLDPCILLDPTTDLVLLGGSSGTPHLSSPTDWGPQCDYPTPSGSVQVVVFRPEVSDAVFESSASKVEISALGDTAFYDTDWGRVRVRLGEDRFQVACFCILPSGTQQATLVQLATAAVVRLATE